MRCTNRWALLLMPLVLLVATAGASAQDLRKQIDSYLAERVRADGITGLTAAVIRDGRVFYQGAFGVPKLGSSQALTPQHVFHFASVSKPFVATAIMQLVERKQLKLEDPVVKYLPYFRLVDPISITRRTEMYREITIRQMLNHTSGMPDVADYHWDKPEYDDGAAERFVREMAEDQLLFPPGGGYFYSNKAFDALAAVIASVSGMSFEAYIQKNIFEPLGMKQSSFIYSEIPEALRTTGHLGKPATVSAVYPYNRRHAPSSTLNSSVEQMTRWMLVNLRRGELDGKRILQPESYGPLWNFTTGTPRNGGRAKVGLSWFLKEHRGRRVVFHGGGDTGFASFLMILPDDFMGIVIATNWQETDRETMAYDVLDLLLKADVAR